MFKNSVTYSNGHQKGSIALSLLLFSMIMMTLFGVFMKYTVGEVSTQEALVEYHQRNIDKENLKRITQEAILEYYESIGWNPIGTLEETIQKHLKTLNGITIDGDGNEVNSGETYTFAIETLPSFPSNNREIFWKNIGRTSTTDLDGNFRIEPNDNSLYQSHTQADNYLIGHRIYSIEDISKALDQHLFEFTFSKTHKISGVSTEITISAEMWQVPITDFQLIAYSMYYTNSSGTEVIQHVPTQSTAPSCPNNLRSALASANAFALVSSGINTDSPATSSDGLDLPYYYRTQMSAVNVVWEELWRATTGAYINKYQNSNFLTLDAEDTSKSVFESKNTGFDPILFTGITFDYTEKKWIIDVSGIDNSISNLVINTDTDTPLNSIEIKETASARTNPLVIYTKHHSLDIASGDEALKIYITSDIDTDMALFCDETNTIINSDTVFDGSLFLSPNATLSIATGQTLTLNGSLAVNANNFSSSINQIDFNRIADSPLLPYAPRFLIVHTR